MKQTFARLLMILLVMMLGIEIGAGLYEARVLVPLWAPDPQAAQRFWVANPSYAEHSGERWWMFSTPLTGLIALAATITAGGLPKPQQKLVRSGGTLALLTVIATFIYFVPAIIQLHGPDVQALSAEAAKNKARLWDELNWVRAGAYISAWILVVRAVWAGLEGSR